ncbi:DHH family phosphoesterase [Candidatus Uhrbacteria bacterium]|nr:DHH family phosphoesterase [Candidatus Uhrbacteria bacterium]
MHELALYKRFHDLLMRSRRTLLVAHKKPDGDTLGSASAVLNYLIREGHDVVAFCADAIPEQYHYLPGFERFTYDPGVFQDQYDLLCVFDAGDPRYAGIALHLERMPQRPTIVNIDHHATNERYGDQNLLFTDASSTAEVVHRFFTANGITIDPHMATCLLTGIVTDTSNFVNPATNATCIRAASNLLICGARMGDITRSLVRNKSIPALQLWGRALERIRENHALGIASTIITKEDVEEAGADVGEATEGIANFLGAVLDVAVIMVLKEQSDGLIKGSLRSNSKDVSAIAKLLGGGGHKKAAGFTVRGKLIEKDGIWQVEPAPAILEALN